MTMNINTLADEIISGRRLTRDDDLSILLGTDLVSLCGEANRIRRTLCGDRGDLCTIINGRSGKCSENCRFCAQSAHHCTGIGEYGFLDAEEILTECRKNEKKGIHRFSIVTAGRDLSGKDFDKAVFACELIKRETDVEVCASMGLLDEERFRRLYRGGVRRYHCNLETSRRNFPNICTTHTYDDKIRCIKAAQSCGLEICSGGIIGLGETWEDRLDMALELAELGVVSVPVNVLKPISGTPLGDLPRLTHDEILRTVAAFRFILPEAYIRFAAGRELLPDSGREAFLSGANAAITGDMLTTSGSSIRTDIAMFEALGLDSMRNS